MSTGPQTDKSHYHFDKYSGEDRWTSYFVQLREVLALKPRSVLEIGVGEDAFGHYLRRNTAIAYTSLDIADDLKPDTVGDIRSLPFADRSFDVVCAFEVLEHIPFDDVARAVAELARVCGRFAIVSVPHFGPSLRLELKLPLLPRVRLAWKVPFPKKHIFNGQHHWEIGKRGYPLRRIHSVLQERFTIEKEFVPFGNQYHRFFVLRPR